LRRLFCASRPNYPQRHQLAARVRAFVDFVALSFAQQPAGAQA
jgi:hypothetical protein